MCPINEQRNLPVGIYVFYFIVTIAGLVTKCSRQTSNMPLQELGFWMRNVVGACNHLLATEKCGGISLHVGSRTGWEWTRCACMACQPGWCGVSVHHLLKLGGACCEVAARCSEVHTCCEGFERDRKRDLKKEKERTSPLNIKQTKNLEPLKKRKKEKKKKRRRNK